MNRPEGRASRRAFARSATAEAGAGDAGRIVARWETRKDRLALYARAFLAMALARAQPDHPLIPTLPSAALERAGVTATGAFRREPKPDDFNRSTEARTAAIALLSLLRLDPDHPLAFPGGARADGRAAGGPLGDHPSIPSPPIRPGRDPRLDDSSHFC